MSSARAMESDGLLEEMVEEMAAKTNHTRRRSAFAALAVLAAFTAGVICVVLAAPGWHGKAIAEEDIQKKDAVYARAFHVPGLRLPSDLRYLKGKIITPSGLQEPITLREGPDNKIAVDFAPKESGEYLLYIMNRGRDVEGSPFAWEVGSQPEQGSETKKKVGSQASPKVSYDVAYNIPGLKLPDDLQYIKTKLTTPSGSEEHTDLKAGPSNTVVVSFLPKKAGKYLIHIQKKGKDVGDSPYSVNVPPEGVAAMAPDVSKVKCTGSGLHNARANRKATFLVDTRDAGSGGLNVDVDGPSKVVPNAVDNEDGTFSIDFTPTKPGQYLIKVMYAETHVPGSPFKLRVEKK